MKKISLFLIGAVVGLVACFILIYISGMLFEYLGVQLYDSEADQQRNFNIYLVVSAISSLVVGILFAKKMS